MIPAIQQARAENSAGIARIIKDWSTYTAIGTFALYGAGYLALRFHITALGIVTDLSILDERYLFAGAHFFVYTASCLPYIALAIFICFLVARAASSISGRVLPWLRQLADRPELLLSTGLLLAFFVIQREMRWCFTLVNLPFAAAVPTLLSRQDDLELVFFFTRIIVETGIVWVLVIAAWRRRLQSGWLRGLLVCDVALAAVMTILVPINFGSVVMPYDMERTTTIGKEPVKPGQCAWRVWEGKEWMTYFVKDLVAGPGTPSAKVRNRIIAVPTKDVEKLEVSGSDSLFSVLYSACPSEQ